MKNLSRCAVTFIIALAFVAGIAGGGCNRARHLAATTGAPETIQDAAHAQSSNEVARGVEKSAAQTVNPSELAKHELENNQTGHVVIPVTGKTVETAKAEAPGVPAVAVKEAPPQPMCYVEAFHHKPTPGDTDEESSSHHKNQMTLAHVNINSAHICVRVNGIPVKFSHKAEKQGDQILIGAIAGPSSKITVSYCVGKLVCPEVAQRDCTVPKDEFMDALGGGENDDAAEVPTTQWEGAAADAGKDAKLNADVKKELSDIDGMNAPDSETTARGPAAIPVFKGWIEDQNAPACPKQAS